MAATGSAARFARMACSHGCPSIEGALVPTVGAAANLAVFLLRARSLKPPPVGAAHGRDRECCTLRAHGVLPRAAPVLKARQWPPSSAFSSLTSALAISLPSP